MSLYLVQFDGEPYHVEAASFPSAIEAWKRHVEAEWGDDCDGTEEPESVTLLDRGDVIR